MNDRIIIGNSTRVKCLSKGLYNIVVAVVVEVLELKIN